MARSIVLGNGNMLVGLDQWANVRDFYFPMVGLENQVGDHLRHRIGVWVDGAFSWLNDGTWQMHSRLQDDTLASDVQARNETLGVSLSFEDVVYNERNIFLRSVKVKNLDDHKRDIRVFFAQEFELYASSTAHTAYFNPIQKALIHYKVRRALVVNASIDGKVWSEYTTGVFGIEGKEGSYRDAEDGRLSENPIEHGPTDSVLGLYETYEAGEEKVIHYWVTAAKQIDAAIELNRYVLERGPSEVIKSTKNFWHSWTQKDDFHFPGLDEKARTLFQKSLLVIRAHTNNNGGVIASSDSGMLQKGKDTYAYVWPRDSAFVALAMSGAGYQAITGEFFRFSNTVVEPEGYFMHKYNPDMSVGSSWHPWVRDGQFALPIQKDETALVLYSFWQYYQFSKNLELVEEYYDSLVRKTANFLCGNRDAYTKLPSPSYDLWEERFGIHTFTVASIYAGLVAASEFARLLGKEEERRRWLKRAEEIRGSIMEHLYDERRGVFYRMINVHYKNAAGETLEKPEIEQDETIDFSSAYGIFLFGVLNVHDKRLENAMKITKDALSCEYGGAIGGFARYENDAYHRVTKNTPGNPWFITTLWAAQYEIAHAKTQKELSEGLRLLTWAQNHAEESGVMAEQLNPQSGASLSATPLTWSHAEYVRTVLAYLEKMEELNLCDDCNPINKR